MKPVMLVATRLARFDLRRYLVGALLWMPVSVIPLAGGLVLQQLFDHIGGHRPAALEQALWLCAAFVGVEVVRGVVIVVAWTYGVYWWAAARDPPAVERPALDPDREGSGRDQAAALVGGVGRALPRRRE
ncbi:hypothetical protein [Nonomuraea dietziae]|uniref:hypothetical protein n=1 Tax=Nonomuraea dietziae TaxID=65515 RepID=UPI0031CE3874